MAKISFKLEVTLDLCNAYIIANLSIEKILDKNIRNFITLPATFQGSTSVKTMQRLCRTCTLNYDVPDIESDKSLECELVNRSISLSEPMKQWLVIGGLHYDQHTFLARFTKLGSVLYG